MTSCLSDLRRRRAAAALARIGRVVHSRSRHLRVRLAAALRHPTLKGLPWRELRLALWLASAAAALLAVVLVGYELALARVPEHRAALERLIKSQTGLDLRFSELGLRWGWYGPEAVFRRVELGEPGSLRPLVRTSELIVSFDVWSTLRGGDLAAGRITVISPDIDLEPAARHGEPGVPARAGVASAGGSPERWRVLERWRGGRLDIEGGTVLVADPGGSSEPLLLHIRSASLRRAGRQWSASGFVLLPEQLGRAARIALQLDGDLAVPDSLSGTVRVEGYRLRLPGWRDLFATMPQIERFVPTAGGGDFEASGDLVGGRLVRASGKLRAGGLELTGLSPSRDALSLDRLRGSWQLAASSKGFSLQVDSLELGRYRGAAHLTLDEAAGSVRGHLERAPLAPVMAFASWLAPHLKLAGAELDGTVRDLSFDWNEHRSQGQALRLSAALENVSLSPPSEAFVLGGLTVAVTGSEAELIVRAQSRSGRLVLAHAPEHPLLDLDVESSLRLMRTSGGWELSAPRLELAHDQAQLSIHGTLSGTLSQSPPVVAAHGSLTGVDVPLLEQLFGDSTRRAFGAAASHLTAGQVEDGQFTLRGPLDERLLSGKRPAGFSGSLTLRASVLSGDDLWPNAQGIAARIDWRGARIEAQLLEGHAGPFSFEAAQAEWDALGQGPTHVTGRVRGRLEDAIAWLRSHPALNAYAPRAQDLDLRGDALLDLNVQVPPAGGSPGLIRSQVTAQLDAGQLQVVAGLPAITALHGTLSFHDGRLERSSLAGSWLGGPATLRLSQRDEHGGTTLMVQGHGVLDAGQFTLSGAPASAADLVGSSEWSGELAYQAARGSQLPQWHARADSSLVGVASSLPEPLAKSPGTAVPLHIEVQGGREKATLRLSLGERLRSVVALNPGPAPGWIIERGDLRLGSGTVSLPAVPVLRVQGRLPRLELPPYLVLWQQLRRSPGAPALSTQLLAAEMLVAGHRYPQVRVLTSRTPKGDQLELQSQQIMGVAGWPAVGEPQAADLHLLRLTLPEVAKPSDGLALLAAFAPAAKVSVDELTWAGHSLGKLTGSLEARPGSLDIKNLLLSGPTQGSGTLRCSSGSCRAQFSLDTRDAAASLRDFGFRAELAATKGSLTGELEWPLEGEKPLLARLAGHVDLSLQDGTTRPAGAGEPGAPFPLLSVPALVAAMSEGVREAAQAGPQVLRFASLEGGFDLDRGVASTSNLHFDGDAEILVRGRLGLVAQDYDQQVWILRGEERLPAAVRRLGPSPRVAAVWLSLRELFAGEARERSRALHLQGSWDAPIVLPQ
jgi:uncharacterized protein YhdP